MHAPGLAQIATFQDATRPTHLVPDAICAAGSSIPRLFALRGIGKLETMAASEDCVAIKDSNSATTTPNGAEKPMPLTAHVAGRGIEINRIAFGLPFPTSIPVAIF